MKKDTHETPEKYAIFNRILTDGAAAWNITPRQLWLIWCIPIVAILTGLVAAILGKEYFKYYTQENGIAEIIQVLLYCIAFYYCFQISRLLRKEHEKLLTGLYLFVLIGLFFMIGEEISWGQHIFGWETAENYMEINKQDETNLHNIDSVEMVFKWLQLVVGMYGTLLPILLLKWSPLKRNENFFNYIIPHYTLIPFFAPLFFWRIFRNFFNVDKAVFENIMKGLNFFIMEFNEVMELCFAAGMAFFMIYQWRRLRRPQKKSTETA